MCLPISLKSDCGSALRPKDLVVERSFGQTTRSESLKSKAWQEMGSLLQVDDKGLEHGKEKGEGLAVRWLST